MTGLYRPREPIRAWRVDHPRQVLTWPRAVYARSGDWIVDGPSGREVLDDVAFRARYERFEENKESHEERRARATRRPSRTERATRAVGSKISGGDS